MLLLLLGALLLFAVLMLLVARPLVLPLRFDTYVSKASNRRAGLEEIVAVAGDGETGGKTVRDPPDWFGEGGGSLAVVIVISVQQDASPRDVELCYSFYHPTSASATWFG